MANQPAAGPDRRARACEAIRSSRAARASQQPVLAAPYPGAKAFG